jgi:hypothetical protein
MLEECTSDATDSFMTRVFTIFDLIWFLLSLMGRATITMARANNKALITLVAVCLLTSSLALFLSVR